MDKFSDIEGIGQRPIVAIDATYQEESSHYARVLPTEGGDDNQKGHLLLTYYDLHRGIPVNVRTENASRSEMRILKAQDPQAFDWNRVRQVIYLCETRREQHDSRDRNPADVRLYGTDHSEPAPSRLPDVAKLLDSD